MIPLDADQATYDAWVAALTARANDPGDPLHMADVMDANNIYALAHELAKRHPDLRPTIAAVTPRAVELAMSELGTFAGARSLALTAGLPPEEGEATMLDLMRRGQ